MIFTNDDSIKTNYNNNSHCCRKIIIQVVNNNVDEFIANTYPPYERTENHIDFIKE